MLILVGRSFSADGLRKSFKSLKIVVHFSESATFESFVVVALEIDYLPANQATSQLVPLWSWGLMFTRMLFAVVAAAAVIVFAGLGGSKEIQRLFVCRCGWCSFRILSRCIVVVPDLYALMWTVVFCCCCSCLLANYVIHCSCGCARAIARITNRFNLFLAPATDWVSSASSLSRVASALCHCWWWGINHIWLIPTTEQVCELKRSLDPPVGLSLASRRYSSYHPLMMPVKLTAIEESQALLIYWIPLGLL